MKVEAITHNGHAAWQYCIRDNSAGEAYVCHFDDDRDWSAADFVWWGGETHNTSSQMGTRAIDADINLVGQFKQSGTWYIRDDTDNVCIKETDVTFPSYYSCQVISDHKTLWSYTYDH
jgi:hypothetical protein